jgi:hypothetical protein
MIKSRILATLSDTRLSKLLNGELRVFHATKLARETS